MFAAGGPRLGEFQSGGVADLIGPRWTMVAGGVASLLMIASSRLWGHALWTYEPDTVTAVPAGEDEGIAALPVNEPAADD